MRKVSIFLFSLFLSLFSFSLTSAKSLKPAITPESEATVTYISTPEEYIDSIQNPDKTTLTFVRSLDLSDLDFKNEIVIDGKNRLINFSNRSVSLSPENDFEFNYKTNHFLTLRASIGDMVQKIDSLPNYSLLYKATKNGSGIIEARSSSAKILIDGETLDLDDNPTLIRDGKTVAKFHKEVLPWNDVYFYLALDGYNGDNIEFLNLPNYAYVTILLSGENTIKTTKEVGIKAENSELRLRSATADETPTLNIEVNSTSDTAIGIARGLENPEDQQDLLVESNNLNLNFSLKNQTPSDEPFLTGFYARHGDIFLSESTKINLDLNPTLVSDAISSTNNLTGATTELDGRIIIYRNNLTVNNPKGTYGFWSGNVTYIDNNTTGLNAHSDLDSPETKIIVKNSPAALTNRENINDVYYNTQNYVEKISETSSEKIFTLRNLVKTIYLDYTDPGDVLETELPAALEAIESSLHLKNFPTVELENLSIEKNRDENDYYLKIDLKPISRHGFKENCEKSYSYKDIFIKEEEHQNQIYLNNEQTDNYQINSVDSLTIFAPLSVVKAPTVEEPEPTTDPDPEEPAPEPETRSAEPTSETPTPTDLTPEKPDEPNLPADDLPETSVDPIYAYLLLFFLSSLSLLLISRKSLR